MNKYILETNIDFFGEIYKSLNDTKDNSNESQTNNTCLISNEPLIDNFVELKCGHKFNYIPLYHDLFNHKTKFNNMESTYTRLHIDEIRCPYCRTKQIGLLPYYPELGLNKITGVNTTDIQFSVNNIINYKKCEFLMTNDCYNPELPQSFNNKEFFNCNVVGSQISTTNDSSNYGDTKYYCWSHKRIVIKQYKEQIKLKEKQDKKEKKEQEKILKKEQTKQLKSIKQNKNVIIGLTTFQQYSQSINQLENTSTEPYILCNEILKSGINKGKCCITKIFNNNLCKRHYLIKNKHKVDIII